MWQLLSGLFFALIILVWFECNMIRIICHEFAHTVVGLCLGLRIKEIKIEAGCGHVITSGYRGPFGQRVVKLAPYVLFSPLICVLVLYFFSLKIEALSSLSSLLLFLIGFVYCFQIKFLITDLSLQYGSMQNKGFDNQDLYKAGLVLSFFVIFFSQLCYFSLILYTGVIS